MATNGEVKQVTPAAAEVADKAKEAQQDQGPVLGDSTRDALDAADSAHKIEQKIGSLDEAGKANTKEKVVGAVTMHNEQIHQVNDATAALTKNDTAWLNGKGYEVSGNTPPVRPDLPTDTAKLSNAIGQQAADLAARETIATGDADAGKLQRQFSKSSRSAN